MKFADIFLGSTGGVLCANLAWFTDMFLGASGGVLCAVLAWFADMFLDATGGYLMLTWRGLQTLGGSCLMMGSSNVLLCLGLQMGMFPRISEVVFVLFWVPLGGSCMLPLLMWLRGVLFNSNTEKRMMMTL